MFVDKRTCKTDGYGAGAEIQSMIYEIRGTRVMLDFDLAELYRVETRVLNQAVKRNIERFPEDFMFQLDTREWENMSSQFVMTSRLKRPKTSLPYALLERNDEENMEAVNDLSEDLRKEIDGIYQAIAELSVHSTSEKQRAKIGFKH